MITIKTIDAHAAGEPLRLIVDGFPSPRGKTMLDKREWVRKHADHLRRALMLEPRGHADMYGAILTEPVRPARTPACCSCTTKATARCAAMASSR